MTDLEHAAKMLADAMPRLGKLMVDGLKMMADAGMTLDRGSPTVSVTYRRKDDGTPIKITLNVDIADAENAEDDDQDEWDA